MKNATFCKMFNDYHKKLERYFTSSLPSILRDSNDDDNNNRDNDKRAKVL